MLNILAELINIIKQMFQMVTCEAWPTGAHISNPHLFTCALILTRVEEALVEHLTRFKQVTLLLKLVLRLKQ